MYPEKIRNETIDGLGPWFWPKEDDGAWDGPVSDWKSHKATISIVKNKRRVIQAGGCCGLYPKLLSQMFETVITFEPDPVNYYFMKKNLEKITNDIVTFPYALGNENKAVSLNNSSRHNVGTHSIDDTKNDGDVRMVRLDDFYDDIKNVGLLWFDLEGYELNALRGARQLIINNKPMIGIERASSGVREFLSELGYEFFANSEMDMFFLHKDYDR